MISFSNGHPCGRSRSNNTNKGPHVSCHERTTKIESNPPQLLRSNQRICLSYFLSPHHFKIKSTTVSLRVPVGPTKCWPTSTLKPGQPHALSTRQAPVRLNRKRNRTGGYKTRRNHWIDELNGRLRCGKRWWNGGCDDGWRWWESVFYGGFGGSIHITFWAEIHGGWITKEATIVCAETVAFRCLAWLFFRHGWI